jgi:hypothetical protein
MPVEYMGHLLYHKSRIHHNYGAGQYYLKCDSRRASKSCTEFVISTIEVEFEINYTHYILYTFWIEIKYLYALLLR